MGASTVLRLLLLVAHALGAEAANFFEEIGQDLAEVGQDLAKDFEVSGRNIGKPALVEGESIEDMFTAKLVSSPEKDESASEEEEEEISRWAAVAGISLLAATFIGGHMLERARIHRLPEAGLGVLLGLAAAGANEALGSREMAGKMKFNYEFFMVVLLPPIIFEAGFNMNVTAFLRNIGPTALFAFAGTTFSTFVVGAAVYYAGQFGLCYPMGLLASLTFGSLISATDPVTVLSVFQALGVHVDLFSMVFGESVLNDAVAIVLSTTLLSFNDPDAVVDAESICAAALLFATIFVGSMAVGLAYGMASALAFKALGMRDHDELMYVEAALSFCFPWASYYTAEACHLSGIVTILFCGMVMATYTRHNFSPEAIALTARLYKVTHPAVAARPPCDYHATAT